MKEKIGFIGLGAMGAPMARNLIRNGYHLTVYDIVPEKLAGVAKEGAKTATSCKEASGEADIVITMLPSSPQVREAVLGKKGIIEGVKKGSIVIDMSTIDPLTTQEVEKQLSRKGVKMLDAPVARGVSAAVGGTLTIFVGGDRELFEKCKDILLSMGTDIHYAGETGAGEVVKIINNLILSINVCALAEGLVLGVKAGVKPDTLFNALSQGSANSYALQNHFKNFVFKGKFEKGVFPVEYIIKDIKLALKTAESFHIPQYFGSVALQAYEAAVAAGYGEQYYPVVVKCLEDLMGVEVRTENKAE